MPATVEEHINSILNSKHDSQFTPVALEQKRQLTAILHGTPITTQSELTALLRREFLEKRRQYQQFTQEYANLLNADVRSLNQRLAAARMVQTQQTAENVSFYAKEFGQVAYAASFCATLAGSSKGAALGTLASGAMSIGSSCATIAASGALTFGAGAVFAMGVMAVGQGMFGLFGSDDSEQGGGFSEVLRALFDGLAQISQQINHLGKYIEARFNNLEKIIGTNHQVEMGILRQILFRTDITPFQLKQMLEAQHGDVVKKIDKLSAEIQSILTAQRAQLESTLRHRYVTLQEFHFLQIKPERTIVNTVKQLLARNGINDANFVQYSSQLCQAITMESHGSATLTGRDLRLDDMDSINSRLINPLERMQSDQDLEYLAAYNVEFLKNVAVQYGAAPAVDFPLPNLVLFKDRCLAFYDWQYAYAEYKKDPSHRIPESAYQDLTAVVASMENVNRFLHSIDLKKVMAGLSGAMRTDYIALKSQIGNEISQFELSMTQDMLAQRLKYVTEIESLLPHTQNSIATVSETNNILNVNWRTHATDDFISNADDAALGIISNALAPFEIDYRTYTLPESHPWRAINYKKFIENVKKLNRQQLLISVAGYYPHSPLKVQTFPPINLDDQCLGQTQQEILEIQRIPHLDKIQAQQTKIAAFRQELSRLHANASRIHIFSEIEQNRAALNSILISAPRLVKPIPGLDLSLNLYLLLDNIEIPPNLIPHSFYMAELLGIGKIEITYGAQFSRISINQHVKTFEFSLKIKFLFNHEFQKEVELFNGKSTEIVSNIYTNPEEMAYNYWYGLPFYNGELYDLSNEIFIHKNPFLKRIRRVRPLFALKETSINPNAEVIGNELIAQHLKNLRLQCNQKIAQVFLQQRSSLQQSIFKVETSTILMQLFAGLCIPGQLSAINQSLSKIQGRKFSNYIDRLQKDHARESLPPTADMELCLPQLEQFSAGGELNAIIDQVEIGDRELEFLQVSLSQYKDRVRPVTSPLVLSASTASAVAAHTATSMVPPRAPSPIRATEVEILRSSLAAQSQQMAAMQAQQTQLTTEVHELKSMLASMMQLLTQQRSAS